MNTTYVDPLIPLNETGEGTLTRLSANIGTLTGLMDDAESHGQTYLARMFADSRAQKVREAQTFITSHAAEVGQLRG